MRFFTTLLIVMALTIAGCAAFFSVYGIATLFSGAFIAVICMAGALEAGKLVATSFLYRYWKRTKAFLKGYMVAAVFILMLITSMGIFGFLSAAYQESAEKFNRFGRELQIVELQKSFIERELEIADQRVGTLLDIRKQQEDRLSKGPAAAEKRGTELLIEWNRQQAKLIEETSGDLKVAQDKVQLVAAELTAKEREISDIKGQLVEQKDVITFQYVADAFGMPLDKVVKWFILIIVLVFDPLAVSLILAYNTVVYKEEDPVMAPAKKDPPPEKTPAEPKSGPPKLKPAPAETVETLPKPVEKPKPTPKPKPKNENAPKPVPKKEEITKPVPEPAQGPNKPFQGLRAHEILHTPKK